MKVKILILISCLFFMGKTGSAQKLRLSTGLVTGALVTQTSSGANSFEGFVLGPLLELEYDVVPIVYLGFKTGHLTRFRNGAKRENYVPTMVSFGLKGLKNEKHTVSTGVALGGILQYQINDEGPLSGRSYFDFSFGYDMAYAYRFSEKWEWKTKLEFIYAFARANDISATSSDITLVRSGENYYMLGLFTGIAFTL